MLVEDAPVEASPSSGRDARFEDLFRDRYEPVLKAMYLVCGDRDEAEDLTQEAFARVLERWARVDLEANPAGYVYKVALNLYRSRRRRLSLTVRTWSRIAHRGEDDEPGFGRAEDRDHLRRLLRQLPRGQREALVLVEWLGLTDRETAELLHLSPVAVRVRIARARKRLRTEGEVVDGE